MESHAEVGILDYVRLIAQFAAGNISAEEYTRAYFAFNKGRVHLPNENAKEIILRAYGDADDYECDAILRKENPQWIDESELHERVSKALHALEGLGYKASDD